ncbi:hypothetical protein PAAG_11609 [Paracoccidioides lutzii Pb01]|uniref:Uncharacterized protein n=1 Tax=Paracoccidioides lutzii (strain ATCC MYA-826 / Pb01) TaxID=502779 RepID=A0A0A2V5M4_PARBA|nr:hypothetical protein PAAG_11609 [Paracoccidioides lutzii Pb01]KGQ01627.1 hypothetical protein PAAG_11609 [Paracoccidioides lutzii Pb01]
MDMISKVPITLIQTDMPISGPKAGEVKWTFGIAPPPEGADTNPGICMATIHAVLGSRKPNTQDTSLCAKIRMPTMSPSKDLKTFTVIQ